MKLSAAEADALSSRRQLDAAHAKHSDYVTETEARVSAEKSALQSELSAAKADAESKAEAIAQASAAAAELRQT